MTTLTKPGVLLFKVAVCRTPKAANVPVWKALKPAPPIEPVYVAIANVPGSQIPTVLVPLMDTFPAAFVAKVVVWIFAVAAVVGDVMIFIAPAPLKVSEPTVNGATVPAPCATIAPAALATVTLLTGPVPSNVPKVTVTGVETATELLSTSLCGGAVDGNSARGVDRAGTTQDQVAGTYRCGAGIGIGAG